MDSLDVLICLYCLVLYVYIYQFSTGKVLVTEFVDGVSVGTIGSLPQSIRDQIGDALLDLCLKELFEFRFSKYKLIIYMMNSTKRERERDSNN